MGTASWTDRTLIDSGWYPPEAGTPEQRLRYYARQFGLVEVDATYYALPAEQTAAAWAARTPAGFTFNVKAFSLFTQHPTRVAALPADLRPDLAMVRLHGHSDKWDSKDIHERFGYRYSGRELGEWAPQDRRAGQGGPGDPRAVQQLLPRLRPGQRPAARRTAQGLTGAAGAVEASR